MQVRMNLHTYVFSYRSVACIYIPMYITTDNRAYVVEILSM